MPGTPGNWNRYELVATGDGVSSVEREISGNMPGTLGTEDPTQDHVSGLVRNYGLWSDKDGNPHFVQAVFDSDDILKSGDAGADSGHLEVRLSTEADATAVVILGAGKQTVRVWARWRTVEFKHPELSGFRSGFTLLVQEGLRVELQETGAEPKALEAWKIGELFDVVEGRTVSALVRSPSDVTIPVEIEFTRDTPVPSFRNAPDGLADYLNEVNAAVEGRTKGVSAREHLHNHFPTVAESQAAAARLSVLRVIEQFPELIGQTPLRGPVAKALELVVQTAFEAGWHMRTLELKRRYESRAASQKKANQQSAKVSRASGDQTTDRVRNSAERYRRDYPGKARTISRNKLAEELAEQCSLKLGFRTVYNHLKKLDLPDAWRNKV